MQSWSSKDFTADRAWGALDIANFSGTTVRLHWTDQPYICLLYTSDAADD